jgi:hypothetical protein
MGAGDFYLRDINGRIDHINAPGLGAQRLYGVHDAVPRLLGPLIEAHIDKKRLFLSAIDHKYRWDKDGTRAAQEQRFMAWSRRVPVSMLLDRLLKVKLINRPQAVALQKKLDGKDATGLYALFDFRDRLDVVELFSTLKVRGLHSISANAILAYLVSNPIVEEPDGSRATSIQ